MTMKAFCDMAAAMDKHMQQLAAEGIEGGPVVIDRMAGYLPNLQRIWTGTSDGQLMVLCKEFPGFCRYAVIMEDAFEAERNKPSRAYDGMPELLDPQKRMMAALLTEAATLERGYAAFLSSGKPPLIFRTQVAELNRLHRKWIGDLSTFRSELESSGTSSKALDYLDAGFARMLERFTELEKRASAAA